MYAENEPAISRNEAVLNNLPGEIYTIEADDKIPDNCRYQLAMILPAQNQKQTNTGGLARSLNLKIGPKVMLKVNVGIQDRLINGQTGNVKHIQFVHGSIHKVYAKFSDEQAGLRAMRSSYLGRQNSWVAIEKCKTEIALKKGFPSRNIKRTEFPLILAWASTVHQVQSLILEQGVVTFDLRKQISFGASQIYTALSRVKTYDNLYCIEEFKKSAVKVNKDGLLEHERLKENDLFSTFKRSIISDDTITILVHHVRSLSK